MGFLTRIFHPDRRNGMTAEEVAMRLRMVQFAERVPTTPPEAFYRNVDMPDGKTAWDWVRRWPALRAELKRRGDLP